MDKMRNYIAVSVCNFMLNVVATKLYRDRLTTVIQLGFAKLVEAANEAAAKQRREA